MAGPPKFELFVSCVEGKPCTRFGTGAPGIAPALIGAERDRQDPTQVRYHPDLIVGLTEEEVARFRREYLRQLSDGALRERKRSEWDEQQKRIAQEEATPPKTTRAAEATADEPAPKPSPARRKAEGP